MQSRTSHALTDIPILVVDDSRTMVHLVEAVLRNAGFRNVMHAQGVQQALEALHRQFFGLVLSDWKMVSSSGLDLLRRIRNDPSISAVRFVLMSADGNTDLPSTIRKLGGHGFLRKPFTADAVRASITEALGGKLPSTAREEVL